MVIVNKFSSQRLARMLRRQQYRLNHMEHAPASPQQIHHNVYHPHVAGGGGAAEAEKASEKLREQLLRVHAEFDNYRKRQRRDEQTRIEMASQKLVEALLPVLDTLDRALASPGETLEAFLPGIQMVRRQFMDILTQGGLSRVEAVGQPFDPNLHEAVTVGPAGDQADNTVLEVFQDGYTLNGRLVRPAMVKVARK
jgi:molecular chaperone GrpE